MAARALSGPEQAHILAALENSRDRLLVLAGVFLGFRISELLSLQVADVWTERHGPKREVTVSRRCLKGGQGAHRRGVRSRTVPVHPVLAAAVQDHLHCIYPGQIPAPCDFLFPSRKGSGPITRVQAYRILKTAAGRGSDPTRVSTHSMRKTFAHSIYNLSVHDLLLTQRALGHRSIATTTKYLETTPESVRAVIFQMPGPTSVIASCPELTEPLPPVQAFPLTTLQA